MILLPDIIKLSTVKAFATCFAWPEVKSHFIQRTNDGDNGTEGSWEEEEEEDDDEEEEEYIGFGVNK